jgi:hypothetical protein
LKYRAAEFWSMGGSVQAASSISTKVIIIAMTAALYTVGKAVTGFIPTPFGVGQFLIGVFIPAYFAVVSETIPVAIGAGLGTFIGDVLVLAPLNETTPFLSLVAGVPANFVAFLAFGWFVKRYRSWSAFVAAAVCFVTLGNLIAAFSVVETLVLPAGLILGFTVFWNVGSIPAVLVGVPILIRATRPLMDRSKILRFHPQWGVSVSARQAGVAMGFAVVFIGIGAALFLGGGSLLPSWSGLSLYFGISAVIVLVFGPLANLIAGSKSEAAKPAS